MGLGHLPQQHASQEAETLTVTEEEKGLLDGRWKDFLAAPLDVLTVEQFRELLAARRGGKR
jgi:hypothetical protein